MLKSHVAVTSLVDEPIHAGRNCSGKTRGRAAVARSAELVKDACGVAITEHEIAGVAAVVDRQPTKIAQRLRRRYVSDVVGRPLIRQHTHRGSMNCRSLRQVALHSRG